MPKKSLNILKLALISLVLIACSSPEEKAASYVDSANRFFAEGQFGKAEIEYKNALQINQNLPDAWFGLARIYEQNLEWRKAYTVLIKVRDFAPNHIDGRIMLGQILLAANQLDEALIDAEEILELAPDNADAHALMAAVQYRLDNFDGVREEVRRSLDLDPDNNKAILVFARLLMSEGKHDKAIAILQKAIEKHPEDVSFYHMKVQAHHEIGDREAIEKIYITLVDRFPKNINLKLALVNLYLEDNEIDRAEHFLEDVIRTNPGNVTEKMRLVDFKNQYRSLDDAIALIKTYIGEDKSEYRYQFQLASLYEKAGDRENAIAVYEDIISKDGLQDHGLEARNKKAMLHLRADNRGPAMQLVQEVLEHDKTNENALLLRAGFQITEQDFDDAVINLRTVLRDKPDSIRAFGLLGQAYEAMGSNELAIESYSRAFELDPSAPLIANRLAQNLIRQRKFEKADELLSESIARGNRSVDAIKLLAQAKLALNEWDQAEKLARQLQKFEGQEMVSQQVLGLVYQGREDMAASLEAFKRAHELAPNSRQPIVALVRTYVQSRQFDNARRFLDSVVSVDSDNLTAHLLLGELSLLEKNESLAIDHFKRVIEIDPRIEMGYRGLASTYLLANDYSQAERVIESGLSSIPDSMALSISLASIYERQKKFDDAIEIYEKLLERNENFIIVRNNLASLLTDYRDDQSSWDRAKAMSLDFRSSKIPQLRDTYAWAAVKSGGNLEEAVVILEEIVRENEAVSVFNYHLGEAYRRKGDKSNAVTFLNKAIEHSRPDSEVTAKARQSLQLLN